MLQCGYAKSKRNVLRRILSVLTDRAVRQFSGREFQSLEAATVRNDEQQCPSCAAELTEASVWMIAASETDCMGIIIIIIFVYYYQLTHAT